MRKAGFKSGRLRLAAAISTAAVAVATTTPAAYAQGATQRFDIPEQQLSKALLQLGRQARISIAAPTTMTKGRMSKPVSGDMTAREALERLLAGSGLQFTFTSANAVRVTQAGNASGAANGGAQQVRAGQGQGVLVGSVRDYRTGAALKGARIEVVETGESTATGDLGDFRFARLPTGEVTLRITYLGFPEQTETVSVVGGLANRTDIYLGSGATTEIVVIGQVSARAQALNQERARENTSTIISDDLTGQFDGTTISDALRRASGVAFIPNGDTGEGANVIVRGLAPDFNTVTFNGVRLPEGGGLGRSPSLDNILADSVSKITINKTLLPSQDGSGTGGLVEIETKTPLDRPPTYVSVSLDHARSGKEFVEDTSMSGTASVRFGADKNFGISVSAQYRDKTLRSYSVSPSSVLLEYLPLRDDNNEPAQSFDFIDPRRTQPYDASATTFYASTLGVGSSENRIKNLSLNAAAAWDIGSHTLLNLDLFYSRAKTDTAGTNGIFVTNSGYELLPVDELNGEQRYAAVWQGADGRLTGSVARSVGFSKRSSETLVLNFKGETNVDSWQIKYRGGYTKGERKIPYAAGISNQSLSLSFSPDMLLPTISGNRIAGRIVSAFAPASLNAVDGPGLTEEGFNLLNNFQSINHFATQFNASAGKNERVMIAGDVKREFDGSALQYIQVGAFYEDSSNSFDTLESTRWIGFVPLSSLGIELDDGEVNPRYGNFRQLDVASAKAHFLKLYQGGSATGLNKRSSIIDPRTLEDGTSEQNLAAYLQSAMQLGKFDVIGGFRLERFNTSSTSLYGADIFDESGIEDIAFTEANRRLETLSASTTNILPRLMINFRPMENVVARFGYYTSIARPRIDLLNSQIQSTLLQQPIYGPNGNQPYLLVVQGNPDLKSATTQNFDISLEWYFDNVGAVKIGAFYKPTKNSIFSNPFIVSEEVLSDILPNDPRYDDPNIYVRFEKPENSKYKSWIWGLEASVERRLDFLGEALKDFRIYANAVYTKSRITSTFFYALSPTNSVVIDDLRYPSNPKFSGTVSARYTKGRLDANLTYTWQGRQTGAGVARGDFTNAISTLDARVQFETKLLGSDLRLFLEGADLLHGTGYAKVSFSNQFGPDAGYRYAEGYTGGRTLRAGMTVSF
ncbi:TonB-dependent receptor [Sphingopyxis sp. YR583]|uniref:TonB-dependent receptor n=1 Tax=Sphingopyxis sp. YR583 TaxID=1881047 RepID=UPI0008A73AEC|nr:TonB-dependent receptor [Sphingopyxis sp. YR583]SEH12623.1 TonB-dependent receptor [Sphingopyxis sp. YR583]